MNTYNDNSKQWNKFNFVENIKYKLYRELDVGERFRAIKALFRRRDVSRTTKHSEDNGKLRCNDK